MKRLNFGSPPTCESEACSCTSAMYCCRCWGCKLANRASMLACMGSGLGQRL